jgi:hypothetical protein
MENTSVSTIIGNSNALGPEHRHPADVSREDLEGLLPEPWADPFVWGCHDRAEGERPVHVQVAEQHRRAVRVKSTTRS